MSESKGQMEIFQTGDESDHEAEDFKKPETKDENIVEEPLTPALAFEKFAGKIYDHGADISDATVKQYIRDVSSSQAEFTALPQKKRAFETPLQRYHRLKAELEQFKEDMEALAKHSNDGPASQAVGAISGLISRDLDSLSNEMAAIASNKTYQPYLADHLTDVSAAEDKDSMNELLTNLHKAEAAGAVEAKEAADKITYELYYNPQKEDVRHQTSISALDRRVAGIEKTIGSPDSNFGFSDLSRAVMYMQKRIELLKPDKLANISQRMKVLMTDLEELEKTRARLQEDDAKNDKDTAEYQKKVQEAFSIIKEWDTAAAQLPLVVNRLQSLKAIHEEGAAAVIRMNHIDSIHSQLEETLKQDSVALQSLKSSLESNMKIMQDNVADLQKRFDAVLAKRG